jgi:hypothetical protein
MKILLLLLTLSSVYSEFCNCVCSFTDEDAGINCQITNISYKNKKDCTTYCKAECGNDETKSNFKCEGTPKCIGGSNLLFSCTVGDYVAARDVSVGDQIITRSANGVVCSDVYYVFKHKDASPAYAIQVEGSVIKLSADHLAYVGSSFEDRKLVLTQDLVPGDMLITNDRSKTILSIEATSIDLVNVLTVEPAIELESGVLVSAHSYHETVYGMVFWPFRMLYQYCGRACVESIMPIVAQVDLVVVQPLAAVFATTE